MTGLLKEGLAVWTRVPGTPFTLPGMYHPKERLPGMSEWVPRDVVERVSRLLKKDKSLEEVAHSESGRGLLGQLGFGGVVGGIGGGLLGRLVGGEGAVEPLKNILSQGINSKSLRRLKGLSGPMRWLPLLGAGAGALAGGTSWAKGKQTRGRQSKDVARGLLAERALQRGALREAIQTDLPYTAPILRGVPIMSASATAPYVATPGSTGV